MATSIIIGILSILVAALAGMNLYTLIDFNARIRRLKEEMMEETKKAVAKASSDAAGFALIHITEAMLHSYTVDYGEIIRLTLNAISVLEDSLEDSNIVDARRECEAVLENAMKNYSGDIGAESQEDKEIFLKLILRVENEGLRQKLMAIVLKEGLESKG